ncbi:uncharacterized protein LOC112342233 [Selaginella moellendorffii]|uniref:uncharacterized protein LOC112342233 n=1 Tax=Selaginella moellendorffii TaxID=88036 RepID=UPI000D1D0693|nr:uncharacterized protein LOC112342233 [Selaginella moellendorffii]|eukprot:XP_024519499.1 uncharacterized protein LOC112342233 [Selaginella moellendorffii]
MEEEGEIGSQCRARLEALQLDATDPRATREALRWGMQMLARIQCSGSGRVESREAVENAAGYEASSSSSGKRRVSESPLANPSSKIPRLDSTSRWSLQGFLKMVECGEIGNWMAERVSSNMRSLDATALVAFVSQCLLLSLDQSPEGGADGSVNYLWLHWVMVKEVLCSNPTSRDENLIELPELDWLLAYLTAAEPENFLQSLMHDVLVKEYKSKDASIVPYVKQAGILEFAASRVPELVVPAVILLMQNDDGSEFQYKMHAWAVQSALCPKFLATVATALVTSVGLESLEKFWKAANFRHVFLPVFWTSKLEYKPALDGCHTRAWLSVLIIKHFEQLSPVAADIVLLVSKVDPALLEWLNKRLSSFVMMQAAGNSVSSSFLQSLVQNTQRLWNNIFSRTSASCQSEPVYARDALVQTCQITLLGSDNEAATEFLAQACAHGGNAEVLAIFVTLTQMLGVMGKAPAILTLWAKKVVDQLHVCDSAQVLVRILAIRQLLNPSFWSRHVVGTAWRSSLKNLCDALNGKWLGILALLQRADNAESSLHTLGVLQSLAMEGTMSSEDLSRHLKGALGLLFYRLKKMDNISDYTLTDSRWIFLREAAILRRIIAHLGSFSFALFNLLVTILLNFSFEAGIKRQLGMSSNIDISKVEHLMSKPGFQTTIALAAGNVDRYGRMEFIFSKQRQLDDCSKSSGITHSMESRNDSKRTEALNPTFTEICSLLEQSFRKSIARHQEKLEAWPCHPVEILEKLLVDRLETPHEISITMEQYEEVLPKHVAFVRHTFITECFHQNPLLFKVLELVMEHGQARQLEACAEFVRALLADSISHWYGAFRRQQTASADKDRMQLFNIIQLVTSARWLPQPLASCGEIIALISTEDVTTLLLIIWRCMHNELASAKNPSETNSAHQATPEENKDIPGRDWETQFLSILRHNVSRIGAHFVRLYPQHKLVTEASNESLASTETDQTGRVTE